MVNVITSTPSRVIRVAIGIVGLLLGVAMLYWLTGSSTMMPQPGTGLVGEALG